MMVIFVCNFVIIYKTKREDLARKGLQVQTKKNSLNLVVSIPKPSQHHIQIQLKYSFLELDKTVLRNSVSNICHVSRNLSCASSVIEPQKPFYLNLDHVMNKIKSKTNNSKKIIQMRLVVSFSFAFLNLPYLVLWLYYYVEKAFFEENLLSNKNLYAYLQLFEIFYVAKYAIYFYINYGSSSVFREQLKYIRKLKERALFFNYF